MLRQSEETHQASSCPAWPGGAGARLKQFESSAANRRPLANQNGAELTASQVVPERSLRFAMLDWLFFIAEITLDAAGRPDSYGETHRQHESTD
jgi:hypothetical protein